MSLDGVQVARHTRGTAARYSIKRVSRSDGSLTRWFMISCSARFRRGEHVELFEKIEREMLKQR